MIYHLISINFVHKAYLIVSTSSYVMPDIWTLKNCWQICYNTFSRVQDIYRSKGCNLSLITSGCFDNPKNVTQVKTTITLFGTIYFKYTFPFALMSKQWYVQNI